MPVSRTGLSPVLVGRGMELGAPRTAAAPTGGPQVALVGGESERALDRYREALVERGRRREPVAVADVHQGTRRPRPARAAGSR